ncbi:MKI67 FHA domain-interacting nucleolar phosphoprotein [Gouania willdenowi]|uniref:RRM domain-containing protein n=1 Tax=Gouania willdenowi TaxID=441366 RepID=A0A8C5G0S7_GOUWI|nr:MKI67 FHA domain-interacting nucleolar phosphoprotein [Gouania willdenowi]
MSEGEAKCSSNAAKCSSNAAKCSSNAAKCSSNAKQLLALDPSHQKEFKKKVEQVKKNKSKKAPPLSSGVVYVGHLPVGLFEPQLNSYFGQFGKIQRLRLSRSKKTGGSRGYAFIEFDCDEVAKIVAETMNNYLMGERLIKCRVIPPEQVHEQLFVGSQTTFKKPSQPAVTRYNGKRSLEQTDKMTHRLLSKEAKLRKRLEEMGVAYDFPGFAAQVKKKKNTDTMDSSTCSDEATPVCTPSLLERRKSMVDDDDDEIIIKMPAVENNEEDGDEEDGDEEDGDEESEERRPH